MSNLGIAIVRRYERGVVFRPGQVRTVREPGLRFMIPLVDRMRKVSLRTVTMPIPSQQIITRDNVSIGVAAVACFRRVDPAKSADHPIALQLRNLQVLSEIAVEHDSTIVFPAQFLTRVRELSDFVTAEHGKADPRSLMSWRGAEQHKGAKADVS
ncbi:regulator of protease activity HflC (stomatin/prohibitin superfamily) [Streptosporangium album]|uniref:Regulator of protease activity HflC (Stomatin/prohibitin superfamily) n=1 Tax=Streptosporangium album TaxID=47479 RepID=A0A7W7S0W6_9ACTN|nr:SPFH domain-containing protein [Streptosporangium album]MBB4941687.1 regulator of protease activity HflC (stomatin/prohibitin superfamily) [Streptosporangium album]